MIASRILALVLAAAPIVPGQTGEVRARTWDWDGSGGDRAQGCAWHDGALFVCGNTGSPDLAPRGVPGHMREYGPRESSQAWFARVDPESGRFLAFTYFGAPGEDRAYTCHAGPHGLTGVVWSQRKTAHVIRYDAGLRSIVWKAALTGSERRQVRNALDVNEAGRAFVAGLVNDRAFVAAIDAGRVAWERDIGAGHAQTGVRVLGDDVVAAGQIDDRLWVGRLRARDGEPVWERRGAPLETGFNDGVTVGEIDGEVRIAVSGTRDRTGIVVLFDGGGTELFEIAFPLDVRGRLLTGEERSRRTFFEAGALEYLPDGRLFVTGSVGSLVAPWFVLDPDGAITGRGLLPKAARARESVLGDGCLWISGNTSQGTPGKPWQPRSATLTRLVLSEDD